MNRGFGSSGGKPKKSLDGDAEIKNDNIGKKTSEEKKKKTDPKVIVEDSQSYI